MNNFWYKVYEMFKDKNKIKIDWDLIWLIPLLFAAATFVGSVAVEGVARAVLIAIGGVITLIELRTFFWVSPNEIYRRDTSSLLEEIDRLKPLNDFVETQRRDERVWLHLSVTTVAVLPKDKSINTLIVGFNIDSGLMYDLCDCTVSIYPKLAGVKSSQSQRDLDGKITLKKGERNQFPNLRVTVKDEQILSRMDMIRSGSIMEKGLEVKIHINNTTYPLESEIQP